MSDNEMRLVIAWPSTGQCRSEFALSLAMLVSHIAANGIRTLPEKTIVLTMDNVKSTSIHTNREQLVKRAIDADKTHLLFLDEDMSFHPSVIDIMAGRRQPVIACNYLIKTDQPDFVAVTLSGKRLPTRESDTGLAPIAYSGFGCSLFALHAFKQTPQPWFLPEFNAENSTYTTEDNPCFKRLREAGFSAYCDHDASKLIDHNGPKAWRWNEWKAEEVKHADK